ncbi:MAG TPA: fatty acid desaturase [Burkholderiales bacterium]|jgi:stearoyl-CoA desaturase (delta-9 desaturase)
MSLTGLIDLPWWGYVVVTLATTHVTIAAVTIFLHRQQAHRALDLHPIVGHFFRFWLWLTTGMVTKEWAAIHRKHHAKVESPDDPHSPQQWGIKKVLWDGVSLYKAEARNVETLNRYGHGTPDDWLERHVYAPRNAHGIALLFVINVVLFGPIGITIWAVQMAWIPLFAAGVINGIGHYFGYRNYEVQDASTNIVPWGVIIGGEELHNNHHTFPSSAKLSSKRWEFDIGWLYIRTLETIGLARVKKIPPELTLDTAKDHIDIDTVRAVVTARFHVMAQFTRDVLHHVHREELKKADPSDRESWALLKRAKRLMVREAALLDDAARTGLSRVLEINTTFKTVYAMKQKLADIWQRSAATQEHLRRAIEDWCHQAEATGIKALQEFSFKLRSYRLVPAPA